MHGIRPTPQPIRAASQLGKFADTMRGTLHYTVSSMRPSNRVRVIMIDAKYKSNLYFKSSNSQITKNEHRADIHQIMCYSSFTGNSNKYSILCYPSEKIELSILKYRNPINSIENQINVLGLPLSVRKINEMKKFVTELLIKIDNLMSNY